MLKLDSINETEYFNILNEYKVDIPIWSDKEAVKVYKEKEIIKVYNNSEVIVVFLVPLNNNSVRREYRYFPYTSPIFLKEETNLKKKEVLKLIFNYLFNKYEYCFIPLHPNFNIISSIASESGFIEMRHTHVATNNLVLNNLSSKLRNHINSSSKKVEVLISNNYDKYDFNQAIKGTKEEVEKRSNLAKMLLDNKKAISVIALSKNKVVAGLIVIYDNNWAYLLHSYQDKTIRGVVPLLIYNAINYCFENTSIKYFDLEGSVIDEIDDFFSSFDINLVTYPFLIEAKTEEKFFNLIKRSINIEGRIRRCNYEYKSIK